MDGEQKLKALREEMASRNYDAYIIPHGDNHDNEYIAEADERIKFICNFSGSNGLGLVTKDVALMWTDGRYYIQIEKELYPGWKMMKMQRGEETLSQYINKNILKDSKIALDFNLFSIETMNELFQNLSNYTFVNDENNIIDFLWKEDKPKYKEDKVIILPEEYTGKSVLDKFKTIGEKIKQFTKKNLSILEKDFEIKIYRLLLSRLDDIAWMLNLRGSDIPYNPVFFSYALLYITEDGEYFHLFANKKKFDTPELTSYLQKNNIILHNYDEISDILQASTPDTLTLYDKESTNFKIYNIIQNLKNGKNLVLDSDIVEHEKSIKNKVEIEGIKSANIRDCVALANFFSWMEEEIVEKKRTDLNEYQIGIKNKQCREEQKLFIGESFAPICAAGSNAAIIHYEQNENLHSDMNINKIILCDTGGQYMDGTTDITRTVHYGTPTKEEKEMYTRVLLGNISLERTIFKKGITLRNIDAIPRSFLFQVGKDYLHGTSHGVGHCLNVHEGPYGVPLKDGYIMTNEPGYYEKDNFGIRIENMVLVHINKEQGYFENLTMFPYERNLIDLNLLSPDMVKYIDDFHKKVCDTLTPLLKDNPKALDYIKRKTLPLGQ